MDKFEIVVKCKKCGSTNVNTIHTGYATTYICNNCEEEESDEIL